MKSQHLAILACSLWLLGAGCGTGHHTTYGGGEDLALGGGDGNDNADLGGNQQGCGELQGCYTVYAHADHYLYSVDLANKMLVPIGPFNAPMVSVSGKMVEDVMTDLAVAPDNTIYTISHASLYTADPNDGHVTLVGSVSTCGQDNVALTQTPDGNLYAADYKGAFCRIDISTRPPTVHQIGTLGNNEAVSGDLVAVSDGTIYATAYSLTNAGSTNNNSLVTINPQTGAVAKAIGATGFPKLYGVAFDNGVVYGFTHDGSGNVVTINPKTGKGTLYATFKDPMSGMPISFAGAGVNPMVMAPPPG